jgi:hypothetical protein
MSSGVLFALGALVTVLVAIGVGLPIYGAILDGRYQSDHRGAEVRRLPDERVGPRSAA